MDSTTGQFGAISDEAARRNLAVLIRLRWLAICGQIGAIAVTHYGLGVNLPRRAMAPVVVFLVLLNLFSTWRLRTRRKVSDLTVTTELLMDVVALTMLLYLSGGASNPFITLFILQVILGIVLLPARSALVILSATIAAYYWLLWNGRPMALPSTHGSHGGHAAGPSFFDLHLQGMFLSFALAACLLAWFMLRIMENLRERDRHLEDLRRMMLEEDNLVRLGLMASGAAHELGTPLTTLAVTMDDWASLGLPEGERGKAELSRMQEELSRCRRIVSDMLLKAGQERLVDMRTEIVAVFIADTLAEWRAEGGRLTISVEDQAGSVAITADPLLTQVLRQILDNAAEAGATQMHIHIARAEGEVVITLSDNGPGFPSDLLAARERDKHIVQTDPGRGLGLLLVVTSLRRLSGRLRLSNGNAGGASVSLTLPQAGGQT